MAHSNVARGYFDAIARKRNAQTPSGLDYSLPSSSTNSTLEDSIFDSSVPASGASTPPSSYAPTPNEYPLKSNVDYNLQDIVIQRDESFGSLASVAEDRDHDQETSIKRPADAYFRPDVVQGIRSAVKKQAFVLRDAIPSTTDDEQLSTSSSDEEEAGASLVKQPAFVLTDARTPNLNAVEINTEDTLKVESIVPAVGHEQDVLVKPTRDSQTLPTEDVPDMPTREAPEAPEVGTKDAGPIAVTAEHERDLILPVALSAPVFSQNQRDPEKEAYQSEESSQSETARVADLEKQEQNSSPTQAAQEDSNVWTRFRDAYYRAYAPRVEPSLLLPTGPTDVEKYSYLKTNRLGLYVFGVVSFASLSAGMWLFVLSSVIFSWFGVFFGLLQIYLIISYTVSLCGKDFDFEDHKKILEEHPITPETCPTVDIYLPCCKEPIEVLENTYKHVRELEWPEGKLQVHVMDDGAMDSVKTLAESYGFNYICREDRPRLKKAGNLRWTFARTSADYFTIYDADFCPRPDFLLETVPQHLADDKTAIIQTPQFFRVSDEQTWVEQGASAVQELFYRVVQVNRNRWGASICVGSNAVYRRAALEEVGGTAEIGFSEDVHTGFGAVDRGWKVKYVPICLACGICPDNPRAFFSQQMRWCMGSTTLLTNPEFWTSSLSITQKICYLCGMMYYSAMALSIFISPVPGIFLLWFRPEFFKYYNLAFAIPSLVYGLLTFRLWAKASYGINVQYIMIIQSYAYLNAIKDRLLGNGLAWAPSGDNKSHKNNKYRNMRILCVMWTTMVTGFLVGGVTYRVLLGMHWFNCVPLLCLHTFNMLLAHRFLLWSG